jgi:hypothetical protein
MFRCYDAPATILAGSTMGETRVLRLSDFRKRKPIKDDTPATVESVRLLRGFMKIKDPLCRAKIIRMVERMANQ